MTTFGYSRTGIPPVSSGRLLSRSIHALREPRGRSGDPAQHELEPGGADCRFLDCGSGPRGESSAAGFSVFDWFRSRSAARTGVALAAMVVACASSAQVDNAWGGDVEASVSSLSIAPGETVRYSVRLTRAPTCFDEQAEEYVACSNGENLDVDRWFVMLHVDGVRSSGTYRDLTIVPSLYRDFGVSDWRTWKDFRVTRALEWDEDTKGPRANSVTFAHEVWDHEANCPVHGTAPVTVTTGGGVGDGGGGNGRGGNGRGGNEGDGNEGDGNGDGNEGDGNGDGNEGGGNEGGGLGGEGEDTSGDDRVTALPDRDNAGWLRSFGARASAHVMDAVHERVRCAPGRRIGEGAAGRQSSRWHCGGHEPGSASLVLGGRRLHRSNGFDPRRSATRPHEDWRGPEEAGAVRRGYAQRSLTAAQGLSGSSFRFSAGAGGAARTFHLWGRGSYSRFDGRDGALAFDGDVGSATVGAEFGGKRVLTGLALSHSVGSGSLRTADASDVSESTLSGIYPYAHFSANDRLRFWGMVGTGTGSLESTNHGGASVRTGLSTRMAAVGGRGVLRSASLSDRLSLSMDGDLLWVRVRSHDARGLEAGESDVRRLRVGVEGSYSIRDAVGELAPYVNLGVRRDGGDGESGYGLEAGGGVRYASPLPGLATELGVRGLVAHEVEGVSDWGVSGSIRYRPPTSSGRGPSFGLTSSWGVDARPGLGSLWRHEALADSLPVGGRGAGRRIDAQFGYGFAVRSVAGTGTPWVGVSMSERGRDYRVGYRLGFGRSLNVGIEGLVREDAQGGESSDRAVMLRLAMH